MRLLSLVLILSTALLISSCASFQSQEHKAFQTEKASWYGSKFHGRRTASGEKFDVNELTAAHRTLPFGRKVLVKSLTTGRVVVVRINDRGPFHSERIIDLSQAAAIKLDIIQKGEDQVALSLVDTAD